MKKTLKVLLAAVISVAMLMSFAAAEEDFATVQEPETEAVTITAHSTDAPLSGFNDAPAEDSWKYQGLNCAVANGIMNGHNNYIRPDDSLTRAEMVAMMVRVLGAHYEKADISHYVDVAMNQWYYESIESGVAIKIVNGSGNMMMPNDAITREQTFAILARTFLLIENNENAAAKFTDADSVSPWAASATNALIEAGVVLGDSSMTLRPLSNVTRAEFAAMLDRVVCYFAKSDVSYAGATIDGSVIINDASVNLDGAVINGDLYITDAVGDAEVILNNVTVNGRVVVRSGDVKLAGASEASEIVFGNPTRDTSVTADEGIKSDNVVVGENSTGVTIDVPATNVIINSTGAKVVIDSDVENVVINGEDNSITGSGNIGSVTDNSAKEPDDSNDDDGDDDQSGSNKVTTGSLPSRPSGPASVVGSGTYITYSFNGGEEQKFYADVDNNVVTFDFYELGYELAEANGGSLNLNDVVFGVLYVESDVTATCKHDLISFKSNTENSLADMLGDIAGATNNVLVPITDEGTTLYELQQKMIEAYYDSLIFPELFEELNIEVVGESEAIFHGFIGSADFSFCMKSF